MSDDEPRIITVGKAPPPPDIAKWLREQPHHRKIVMCCRDEPSASGQHPVHLSAFRCIDVWVTSIVDGALAGAEVRVADHQASDPIRLVALILEEATAAFEELQAGSSDPISEK